MTSERHFEPPVSTLIVVHEVAGERSERGLRELLARLRVTEPQASMWPNERLLVFPRRTARRSPESRELAITIVGEESGDHFPELVLEIAEADWEPDRRFDCYGPEVAMALNEAWRLPDAVYEAQHELCGRPAFRCVPCTRTFVTFSAAENHVREQHARGEICAPVRRGSHLSRCVASGLRRLGGLHSREPSQWRAEEEGWAHHSTGVGRSQETVFWEGKTRCEADTVMRRCLVPILGSPRELPGGGARLAVRWLA